MHEYRHLRCHALVFKEDYRRDENEEGFRKVRGIRALELKDLEALNSAIAEMMGDKHPEGKSLHRRVKTTRILENDATFLAARSCKKHRKGTTQAETQQGTSAIGTCEVEIPDAPKPFPINDLPELSPTSPFGKELQSLWAKMSAGMRLKCQQLGRTVAVLGGA